jgi:predicted Zn-dependent peptidase
VRYLLVRSPLGLALVALVAPLLAAANPSGDWSGVLVSYGVAAPFALALLVGIRTLWADRQTQEKIQREQTMAQASMLAETNQMLAEATRVLSQNAAALADMTTFLARQDVVTSEQVWRLTQALEAAESRLRGGM